MTSNAVEIRGLEKRFPTFTLGPLDLTVPAGAIYGLIGPNGAGKTTTLDLMFGMGDKHAGSITVMGLDHLRDEVAMKSQVAYVSPTIHFHSWGTVGKAIAFIRSFYPTWDDDYCDRLMAAFGLSARDKIVTLSFGGPVKLKVLLALAWRPRLLVLDEPTIGLDAVVKREIFSELLSAVREGDRTVLIASHGLADLERVADHIGMIKDGRLLVEGPTSAVTERYRLVDLVTNGAFDARTFTANPGLVVQQQDGDRWRVLVDGHQMPLGEMAARGARIVADAPVTLEELFVALAQEKA
jgi:ABC-2 type transport system ATP-binding protein